MAQKFIMILIPLEEERGPPLEGGKRASAKSTPIPLALAFLRKNRGD